MPNLTQQRRLAFIRREIGKKLYPSSQALAKEYEVSARTIQRDIEYLNVEMGADIQYDEIKHGFYFGSEPLALQNIEVNEKEIFLMHVANKIIEHYEGTPLYSSLKQTLNKLVSLIPANNIKNFEYYTKRIIVKSPYLPKMDLLKWTELTQAITQEHRIKITHKSLHSHEWKVRKLSPLAMLCDKQKWYLVAFDFDLEEIRHFGVWRINEIEILKEHFDYPENFNAMDLLDSAVGENESDIQVGVQLKFKPYLKEVIEEQQWFSKQLLKKDQKGNTLLKFKAHCNFQLIKWIISFGSGVRVLKPTKLKTQVREFAEEIARLYK